MEFSGSAALCVQWIYCVCDNTPARCCLSGDCHYDCFFWYAVSIGIAAVRNPLAPRTGYNSIMIVLLFLEG